MLTIILIPLLPVPFFSGSHGRNSSCTLQNYQNNYFFIVCFGILLSSNKYYFMVSKLEAGQVKLQSRLEEEEQAKAALMGRIQRLTKLILVSTKNSMASTIPERPGHRRRHSFGEDEV